MIITTDSLESTICRRKTWLVYDLDKMIAKMPKETFMKELINIYDKYVSTSNYSNYFTSELASCRHFTYSDIIGYVYRPIIDSRSIHVDYPILRSDIGTYYWGFQ